MHQIGRTSCRKAGCVIGTRAKTGSKIAPFSKKPLESALHQMALEVAYSP
jgi:hypothetical protein